MGRNLEVLKGCINKVYDNDNFQTGDSPATHDFNADKGYNSCKGWLRCDGPGDIQVRITANGTDYGDTMTYKTGEALDLDAIDIDTIQIIWVTDSAYRICLW